ncbi:MAG: alpha-1,2-fucosyltransferase [Henriciella sp.]
MGNLLLPISRALVGAKQAGGTFVYPTMPQVKVGTFLRNEKDKRNYRKEIRPRSNREWGDWFKSQSRTKVMEEDLEVTKEIDAAICYQGLKNYFYDIAGEREHIKAWLYENAISKPLRSSEDRLEVAIHLRMGDFQDSDPSSGQNNIRQPLDWYIRALDRVRSELVGSRFSVRLFSDDVPLELLSLMPGISVTRDDNQSALAAIMRMSQSDWLIASRSTFSMWGSYLGDLPTVWPAKFDLKSYWPHRNGLDYFV